MTIAFNRNSMKERRQILRRKTTKPEIILWSKIRRKQLDGFRFRRQYSVNEYVLDFYCSELKVGIEIDRENHERIELKEYDSEREEVIKLFGISILRFTNKEVIDHIDNVLEKIRDTVKSRSSAVTTTFPLIKGKTQKGLVKVIQ